MKLMKLVNMLMESEVSLGTDEMLMKSQTQVLMLVLVRMMVWMEADEDVYDSGEMDDMEL